MVVAHQAVLRVLYAYLLGIPRQAAPKIEIPFGIGAALVVVLSQLALWAASYLCKPFRSSLAPAVTRSMASLLLSRRV